MTSVKLKISKLDWLYIIIIGAFFGFFISLFLYLINSNLKEFSTIIYGTASAVCISLSAFIFITISNDFILPKLQEKFWYMISFIFSFLSGFLGFTSSYFLFSFSDFAIIDFIRPIWLYIAIIIGFFTVLIGVILHQFISMKYKNEAIKSEVLESKIKALENELNPHFLFNALNSISELIYQDQKKAEKATLDLSVFLRNAITKDTLITFDAEIKMVETYLEIENIRFENNIKMHLDIPSDDLNIMVPKFSIQLLVENAIKHGYLQKELNVYISSKDKTIEVCNDGLISKNIKFGTGLSNLATRLKLLKIGYLDKEIQNDKMAFIIKLKK
ncbi:sensor histidine kinase [Arcobacter peruensis]|uniref:sensor histidine kinase n=1 Tax=Arcobacter peruensis TaxID=2320140 RepID=UPI000F0999A9|nr:histidine kinase [Arcobacter peruensis]